MPGRTIRPGPARAGLGRPGPTRADPSWAGPGRPGSALNMLCKKRVFSFVISKAFLKMHVKSLRKKCILIAFSTKKLNGTHIPKRENRRSEAKTRPQPSTVASLRRYASISSQRGPCFRQRVRLLRDPAKIIADFQEMLEFLVFQRDGHTDRGQTGPASPAPHAGNS